jgi:hypothetical protein
VHYLLSKKNINRKWKVSQGKPQFWNRNLKLKVVFIPAAAMIRHMKRHRKILIWILASALTGFGARAVSSDPPSNKTAGGSADMATRPYSSIVDRNVFNLHPPPPPVDPADLAKKDVHIPKLTLNGITTILGKKIVFITMPATKPGGPPQTLMLAEGQAQDEVEAKQIDEKAGVVKVNNHGEDQTLDFDHDGTKPAGPAGNPASPAITIPPVPAAPAANTIPMPQPGMNVIRPLRTLPSRSTPLSGGGFGGAMGSANPATAQAQQPLTSEQNALWIEAQRMKALDENDPVAKILPPTDFTQEITGQGQAPQ